MDEDKKKWGTSSTLLVGFGSYEGSVIAGNSWGARMQKMDVPKAPTNSWEAILHNTDPADKMIITKDIRDYQELQKPVDHRAIGVVYHPEMEHYGNYVASVIPERYDAFIYIDKSRALHAIDTKKEHQLVPETYPFGL